MLRQNRSVLFVVVLALVAAGQNDGGGVAAQPVKGAPPPTLRLQGPPASVWSLALSADGKWLVAGLEDAARLWDAATGREVRAFDHHIRERGGPSNKGAIVFVGLSNDARWLVTRRSHDDKAHLWELATGKRVRSFPIAGDDENRSWTGIALSADGKWLALGNEIWNVATGARVHVLPHAERVETVGFSGDGRLLATGGRKDDARLWDVATGKAVRVFAGFGCVALSGDGKRLLTRGPDRYFRLWDTANGKVVHTLPRPNGQLRALALSADGNQLVTSVFGLGVRLRNVATGKELRTFTSEGALVALTSDGRWLATSVDPGGAILWDVATGKEVRRVQGLGPSPTASAKYPAAFASASMLAVTPDSKWLVAGDNDGTGRTVSLWDLVQGKRVRGFRAELGNVRGPKTGGVAISGDGSRLFWGRDVRDTATGKLLRTFDGLTDLAVLSRDGKRLVMVGKGPNAQLWDVDTGTHIRDFGNGSSRVYAVALSANDKWLCTGDYGTVHLWDATTGKLVKKLEGHHASVTAVAVSPDAGVVVSAGPTWPGGGDCAIIVWDLDSGKRLHTLPRQGFVRSLSISPDGKHLFSSSSYGAARLWDLRTGKLLREFAHPRMLAAVASADHRHVFTCGEDRAPRVWNGVTGAELCRLTSSAAGDWAVFDAANRFDAVNAGNVDLAALYWVRGLETFPLRHFRERYFDPGLLAKHLGFSAARLRPVQ